METATGNGPNASMWTQQQAAANAAGLQNKAWDYIELFYYEQQAESSQYVNPAFLQSIAQQIPGLNYASWQANRQSPTLEGQVTNDGTTAQSLGFTSTPTIVVKGPKGQATPIQSLPSSSNEIASEITLVS